MRENIAATVFDALYRIAGVEQDTLGRRGLARIDVSHNADISGIFKRSFSRHTVIILVQSLLQMCNCSFW